MLQMMSTECPECDEAVPLLARACSHCGAPNPARGGAIAVAAALVVVIVAVAGAAYVATRPPPPVAAATTPATAGGTAQTPTAPATTTVPVGAPAPATTSAPAGPADSDFAWLRSAMTACDEAAAREPGAIYFLVIPLTAEPKDLPDWRLLAVGAIGNAITIPGGDALGGLRSGKLKIYPDDYVFGIQDAATKVIYRWKAASGVKQLSGTEAAKVGMFRMQVQPRRKTDDTDWGDTYPRQNTSCHWVAAIMRV